MNSISELIGSTIPQVMGVTMQDELTCELQSKIIKFVFPYLEKVSLIETKLVCRLWNNSFIIMTKQPLKNYTSWLIDQLGTEEKRLSLSILFTNSFNSPEIINKIEQIFIFTLEEKQKYICDLQLTTTKMLSLNPIYYILDLAKFYKEFNNNEYSARRILKGIEINDKFLKLVSLMSDNFTKRFICHESIFILIKKGEFDKAFEFASLITDNSNNQTMFSEIIESLFVKNNIDTAIKFANLLPPKYTKKLVYCDIIQKLIENDNFDKAIKVVNSLLSNNTEYDFRLCTTLFCNIIHKLIENGDCDMAIEFVKSVSNASLPNHDILCEIIKKLIIENYFNDAITFANLMPNGYTQDRMFDEIISNLIKKDHFNKTIELIIRISNEDTQKYYTFCAKIYELIASNNFDEFIEVVKLIPDSYSTKALFMEVIWKLIHKQNFVIATELAEVIPNRSTKDYFIFFTSVFKLIAEDKFDEAAEIVNSIPVEYIKNTNFCEIIRKLIENENFNAAIKVISLIKDEYTRNSMCCEIIRKLMKNWEFDIAIKAASLLTDKYAKDSMYCEIIRELKKNNLFDKAYEVTNLITDKSTKNSMLQEK